MRRKTMFLILALAIFSLIPSFFAQAQTGVNFTYLESAVVGTQTLLNLLIPLIVTLALIFFLWGITLFIMNAGDPEARTKGIHIMVWGIVSLFVIVGVWGLVDLLAQILGVQTGGTAILPRVITP